MDPVTAAALAGLTAFVTKSSQDLLDTLGSATAQALRKLFGAVKDRFSGDEAALGDLERFSDNAKLYAPVIRSRLDDSLTTDPEFRSELQRILGDVGPKLSVIQSMAEAHGVIGIDVDEIRRGKVTVEQEITSATDVTGAKIKTIG